MPGTSVVISRIGSPLGTLLLGATDGGVCLLEFTDRLAIDTQLATLRRRMNAEIVEDPNSTPFDSRGSIENAHDHLRQLQSELQSYFAGSLQRFTVPLLAPGTPFQERVWAELLQIPYGETRSYEELAIAVGAPRAQRAVGRANGTNRIAIVIPCHRVVNKGGGLGGYGGLLWRKQALLELEGTADAGRLPL